MASPLLHHFILAPPPAPPHSPVFASAAASVSWWLSSSVASTGRHPFNETSHKNIKKQKWNEKEASNCRDPVGQDKWVALRCQVDPWRPSQIALASQTGWSLINLVCASIYLINFTFSFILIFIIGGCF